MPGYHYTPAKFAMQQKSNAFSNVLLQLEEAHLTHIYRVVCLLCVQKDIQYQVLEYLNTGTLPFEE